MRNVIELRNVIKNECENEAELRKIAKRILTEHEVEGDSYGVPTIQDIAGLLVDKVLKAHNEAVEESARVAGAFFGPQSFGEIGDAIATKIRKLKKEE